MTKTTISVQGTHCQSCKMLIEDVLSEISGIKSSSVDFKTGKVVIEYEGKLDTAKVKKEIEAIGKYKVII
ncbi:heavy-metal-associated domain-containing protein [Candidatus Woesearchaeota archaeon]|nr:heavy-metal-associated domain-containing protein [Candidatus Woesearchaeota archaeon]